MTDDVPVVEELRHAVAEQTDLLAGGPTPDLIAVRIRRAVATAGDLLDLLERQAPSADVDRQVRDMLGRLLAWLVEAVGEYHRVPAEYAVSQLVEQDRSRLLTLVDQLDLLGLTLDHAYAATHHDDADALGRQLDVVRENFTATTEAGRLINLAPGALDDEAVRAGGLEVGEDGIPRMPVPEQPDPHREHEETP